MSDSTPLPALPEPDLEDHEYELWGQNARGDFFGAGQMHAYARAAVAEAVQREREIADAMARTLETFEAQGSDKTAALRAYYAHRAAIRATPAPADTPEGKTE